MRPVQTSAQGITRLNAPTLSAKKLGKNPPDDAPGIQYRNLALCSVCDEVLCENVGRVERDIEVNTIVH